MRVWALLHIIFFLFCLDFVLRNSSLFFDINLVFTVFLLNAAHYTILIVSAVVIIWESCVTQNLQLEFWSVEQSIEEIAQDRGNAIRKTDSQIRGVILLVFFNNTSCLFSNDAQWIRTFLISILPIMVNRSLDLKQFAFVETINNSVRLLCDYLQVCVDRHTKISEAEVYLLGLWTQRIHELIRLTNEVFRWGQALETIYSVLMLVINIYWCFMHFMNHKFMDFASNFYVINFVVVLN